MRFSKSAHILRKAGAGWAAPGIFWYSYCIYILQHCDDEGDTEPRSDAGVNRIPGALCADFGLAAMQVIFKPSVFLYIRVLQPYKIKRHMQMVSPSVVQRLQPQSARRVYFDLFDGQASDRERAIAAHYLHDQLARSAHLEADLPKTMDGLGAWMQAGIEKVGQRYRQYLNARQSGGGRRYFSNKAHALYFLKSVAPTKMVDGAWLYGMLARWQESRFTSLIKTYLEELGEGLPTKNHVVLYKKLLAAQGCDRWDDLSDDHYVQGAIQLALAYHADQFLPEVIGFNLGYEQLPLHVLITAYELRELDIDPYYFTLHITVDNADSGHAKQAVEAVFAALPRIGDTQAFWRRVHNGYKLNLLGASTLSVIASFDLAQEMNAILTRKSAIGQYAHSDYRRVAGCTVNDWLSEPRQVTAFITAMEEAGWFKRHQDPQNSRFWKLIQGKKAKMFGVFNTYEQQVIYDWIAGEAANEKTFTAKPTGFPRSYLSSEVKRRLLNTPQKPFSTIANTDSDFDAEECALEATLASSLNQKEAMAVLVTLMSPANHHTASGLMATRIFSEILR